MAYVFLQGFLLATRRNTLCLGLELQSVFAVSETAGCYEHNPMTKPSLSCQCGFCMNDNML